MQSCPINLLCNLYGKGNSSYSSYSVDKDSLTRKHDCSSVKRKPLQSFGSCVSRKSGNKTWMIKCRLRVVSTEGRLSSYLSDADDEWWLNCCHVSISVYSVFINKLINHFKMHSLPCKNMLIITVFEFCVKVVLNRNRFWVWINLDIELCEQQSY